MSLPLDCDELLQRSRSLLQTGDLRAAETLVQQAIERDCGRAEGWNQLGLLLRARGRLGDALQAYGQAAELDPSDIHSRTQIGHLFQRMSFPEDAVAWYREALDLQPDDLILQLNHAFVLPVVAESGAQMHRFRQRCIAHLQELVACHRPFFLGSQDFLPHPYALIYHGCQDRSLLEAYSGLLRRVVPAPPPSPAPAPVARGSAQGDRRRRIGFLSGYFYNHSNGLAFEGWIRHFDRSQFQLVLIHLHDSKQDAVRSRIEAHADLVIQLAADLNMAQQQLINLHLDLLFFTDIGMHPMVTLLACHRFAPVQITGWGVPQTSGMPCIDAYISSALVEPQMAQAHYSERLIQVSGLPCCYLADHLRYEPRQRDFFFLPNDALLVGCLQTFWKLHPDFDVYLEKIAQRVPAAWFVFVQADISSYNDIFLARLQRSAPTVRQRLILLQRMEREQFIALVEQLDLLLDPPYFSSGVTMFDSLHTGTPIVALQGDLLRSRFVAAAYRLIGLEHAPVAQNQQQYLELAVHLLQHPDERKALTARIRSLARRHLYDRTEGLRQLERFALEAIASAQANPGA